MLNPKVTRPDLRNRELRSTLRDAGTRTTLCTSNFEARFASSRVSRNRLSSNKARNDHRCIARKPFAFGISGAELMRAEIRNRKPLIFFKHWWRESGSSVGDCAAASE